MMTWKPLAAGLALAALAQLTLADGAHAAAREKAPRRPAPSAISEEDTLPQSTGRIAAVVNEDAISAADLDARLRLALVSSQLPDNAEVRARLKPQVLRSLIEEQLQIQEARRLNIKVERNEIDQSIEALAKSNNMTRADLEGRFKAAGIPMTTMIRQALAQIAWAKVIQKQIRPRIDITQEEVDDSYEKLKSNAGKPQFLMAEVFLSVDNPAQEASVRQTAERLIEEMKRGANFAAVARQFSQSADAATGGDLGWVQEGQLGDEIDGAIRTMHPGQVSAPVRDASGFHILLMRDRGTVLGGSEGERQQQQRPNVSPNDRLLLKQILLPAPQTPSKEALQKLVDEARRLMETVNGCDAIDARARTDKLSGSLGTVRLGDLPAPVQQAVAASPEGHLAPPLQTPAGIALLMVCKRTSAEQTPQPVVQTPRTPQMPTKEQVLNQIGLQRMELQARRYLRDLRASAFVDIRD